MKVETTRYRISNPRIIHEIMDSEGVVINLDTGTYYSLDEAGAHIWRGIEVAAPVGIIADDLARRYDATRDHILDVITRLIDAAGAEGLIAEADPHEAAAAGDPTHDMPHDGTKPPLEFCVLQRFADMEELLVLDPIHEVEAAGWPLKK